MHFSLKVLENVLFEAESGRVNLVFISQTPSRLSANSYRGTGGGRAVRCCFFDDVTMLSGEPSG